MESSPYDSESSRRQTLLQKNTQKQQKKAKFNQFKVKQNHEVKNATSHNAPKYINQQLKKFQQTNTTLMHESKSYVTFGVRNFQPLLSRSSFPYFLQDDDIQDKTKIKTEKLKVTNRIRLMDKQKKEDLVLGGYNVDKQIPPVNQYLCYDLSQQINEGLYDIKVLAEQIKTIKKAKKTEVESKENFKPASKIRIKRLTKVKGSWMKSVTASQFHQSDKKFSGLR